MYAWYAFFPLVRLNCLDPGAPIDSVLVHCSKPVFSKFGASAAVTHRQFYRRGCDSPRTASGPLWEGQRIIPAGCWGARLRCNQLIKAECGIMGSTAVYGGILYAVVEIGETAPTGCGINEEYLRRNIVMIWRRCGSRDLIFSAAGMEKRVGARGGAVIVELQVA